MLSVAAEAEEGYFVSWSHLIGDGPYGPWQIRGRLLLHDGNPMAEEFPVTNEFLAPVGMTIEVHDVATLSDGNHVIAWVANSELSEPATMIRLLDSSGMPAGEEILVEIPDAPQPIELERTGPALAALPNGGFLLAWSETEPYDIGHSGVPLLVFSSDGVLLDSVWLTKYQHGYLCASGRPDIGTSLEGASALAVWASQASCPKPISDVLGWGDGDGDAIRFSTVDMNGLAVAFPKVVNEVTKGDQWGARVASLADGSYVASWHGSLDEWYEPSVGLSARRVAEEGSPVDNEFSVTSWSTANFEWHLSLASLDSGFVAVWESADELSCDILVRVFSLDGDVESAGQESVANVYRPNDQKIPSVASSGDSSYIIVWTGKGNVGEGQWGVFARAFK